jgi:hypothetical protein
VAARVIKKEPQEQIVLGFFCRLFYNEDDGTRTRNIRLDRPVL